MQTSETRKGDDLASARRFHRVGFRRVLGQRQMRPAKGVVGEVVGEDAAQVALAQNDHMVKAVSTDGAEQTFGERVSPGRARCGGSRKPTGGASRGRWTCWDRVNDRVVARLWHPVSGKECDWRRRGPLDVSRCGAG